MAKQEDPQKIYKRIQAEHGSRGGNSTLKKHGKTHFINAAKKRWNKDK